MSREESISYLKNLSLIVLSITLFILPNLFLLTTTEAFLLPKQILVILASSLLLFLWTIRIVVARHIMILSNPLNLPILIFGVILLTSALLSRNLFDALRETLPALVTLFFYFALTQNLDTKKSFTIALSSLLLGGALSSLFVVLAYFKIYPFPFEAVSNQHFTPLGSPVMHISFMLPLAFLSAVTVWKRSTPKTKRQDSLLDVDVLHGQRKKKTVDIGFILHLFTLALLVIGIFISLYKIIFLNPKPILLPYIYGFQIALASIGDATRLLVSFLLGSGYGTFLTDFTRFHPPSFNQEQSLWNFTFSYSSSFFFELVATTGILGTLSYLFLVIKAIKTGTKFVNGLYIALILTLALSFLVPFSFPLVFLLFTLCGLYTTYLFLEDDKRVFEISVSLVALKHGLFHVADVEGGTRSHPSRAFPLIVSLLILLMTGFLVFYTTRFFVSDLTFAKSLAAASANDGKKTYDLQRKAIGDFSYRSEYYKIFGQVNLALANSIVQNAGNNLANNSAAQKTVLDLLQNSINSGRASVTLAPLTADNWLKLSQIYRNLINVGQNADQFAIVTAQQAINLNPYNPLLRIELGGIYYQLGKYENAESEFQIAVNLKRDFANGYYNLGHALEAKGDLQNALTQYQIVRELVASNKDNVDKITAEIDALTAKIGSGEQAQGTQSQGSTSENQPLQLSTPSATFPPQRDQLKIPPPPTGEIKPPASPIPAPTITPGAANPTPNL